MIWIVLVLLLVCSGCVSASETALFSLNRVSLSQFRASESPFKRRVSRLMERPRVVLMAVLMANTTINVAIFTVSYLAMKNIDGAHPALSVGVSLGVLLAVVLFGEMVPKAIALTAAQRLAPIAALLIHLLHCVLAPAQSVLTLLLVSPLTRLLAPQQRVSDVVTTEELKLLVEQSAGEGVISSQENKMLQGIVSLGDASVREVMTPRVDIQAVAINADRQTARDTMRASRRRKLPVRGHDLDDIRGILYVRDLTLKPGARVADLLRPAHFVPEQINLVQLIRHFRQEGIQLAIVVDEFGGTTGLVSMEDVAERIVGDLSEYDAPPETPSTEQIDENRYHLAGDLSVRLWADRFGVGEIDRRIDTVGGLVLSRLGRLPAVGDSIRLRNLSLTVAAMEGRRVARVLLERVPPAEEETR